MGNEKAHKLVKAGTSNSKRTGLAVWNKSNRFSETQGKLAEHMGKENNGSNSLETDGQRDQ